MGVPDLLACLCGGQGVVKIPTESSLTVFFCCPFFCFCSCFLLLFSLPPSVVCQGEVAQVVVEEVEEGQAGEKKQAQQAQEEVKRFVVTVTPLRGRRARERNKRMSR